MGMFMDLFRSNHAKTNHLQPQINDYVVIDLETTGLYAEDNHIIEIAGIRIASGRPTKIFSSLINYRGKLDQNIVSLTGIKSDDLASAPDRRYVLEKFQEFVGDDVLVGHNIKDFDNKFLWFSFQSVNLSPLKNGLIDTLELARANVPSDSYKLGYLCERFDIKVSGAHRALDDAKSTLKLFEKMVQGYSPAINPEVREYEAESHYNIVQGDRKRMKYLVDEDPEDIESIKGKRFCITTFVPFHEFKTELDLQQFIVNGGGKVGGLTLKTDYLIDCMPDYFSSKERRAIENVERGKASTKIISPDEFLSLANIQ